MNSSAFTLWLAQALAEVLLSPVSRGRRLKAVDRFTHACIARLDHIPVDQHTQIIATFDRWLHTKQIDGYAIPRDDETMDWMEEIVGSIAGLLEEE